MPIFASGTGFRPLCSTRMDQAPPGSEPFRQLRLTDASFDHCHHLPGTAPGLPWNLGTTDYWYHQPRCRGNLQPTPSTSGQGPAGGPADLAPELRERSRVYPTSPFALLGCCRLVLHPALFELLTPVTRHRLERDKRVVVYQLSRNLVWWAIICLSRPNALFHLFPICTQC